MMKVGLQKGRGPTFFILQSDEHFKRARSGLLLGKR